MSMIKKKNLIKLKIKNNFMKILKILTVTKNNLIIKIIKTICNSRLKIKQSNKKILHNRILINKKKWDLSISKNL